MHRLNADLDTQIRHALTAHGRTGIPEDVDLWPRLERLAVDRHGAGAEARRLRRSPRRILVVAALCLAVLTGGVAVATAASPALRHFLQEAVPGLPPGIKLGESMDAQGRPLVVRPLPPFMLYYPHSRPAGLTYHDIGQLIPRGHGVETAESGGGGPAGACVRQPARCAAASQSYIAPPQAGVPPDTPSLLVPFWRKAARVVWFAFLAPTDQRFVQIAEWDAARSSVKSVSHATVPAPDSHVPDTLLVLRQGRTTIAIETNLGAVEARRVAASLQPLKLPEH
jgi:hypothetical protein